MSNQVEDPQTASEKTSLAFRAAMRRFPATVTVISAHRNGADHGMTATAVASLSMDPPSLVVCVNKGTLLHDMLLDVAHFSVNVLGEGHETLSNAFSGKVPPESRFALADWERHDLGMMVLPSAHCTLVCRRIGAVPHTTHTIFIGEVVHVRLSDNSLPLIYENAAYFTPRAAVGNA